VVSGYNNSPLHHSPLTKKVEKLNWNLLNNPSCYLSSQMNRS
jgi:hypothetical protein